MPEIIFILVKPAVSENVGFSLRALKTMGFSQMRIVGGIPLDKSKLKKTAYGSHDLMNNITKYSTLQDALKDIDLKVATSAKGRTLRKDVVELRSLPELINNKGDTVNKAAIIFGSEENGLSTKEMGHCEVVTTIPLKVNYPSLNLGQAVMLYAYELAGLQNEKNILSAPGGSEFKVMMEKTQSMLSNLDINEGQVIHRRILDRLAMASEPDVRMILSVMNRLGKRMGSIGKGN